MEDRLKALSLENDEGFEFSKVGESQASSDYNLCLVGTVLTDHPVNFLVMKHRMASIWRPGRGISVKDLGAKLILFCFFHQHDLRWVMDGGPWTFDSHLLMLHELRVGEEPTDAPLCFVPFWIQVHDLPVAFFTETVGKAHGDFIGSFLSYDVKNRKSVDRPYMRLRVLVDVRLPLKKGKKVRRPGGDWQVCSFKYEKLHSFCFLCGLIGHIDRHCEKFYRTEAEDLVRGWDVSLRASNRRLSSMGGERWLRDDDVGDGGKTIGGELAQVSAGKESPALHGNFMSFSDPKNIQDLLRNLGAHMFENRSLISQDNSSPNLEEIGLEVAEEKKRKRVDAADQLLITSSSHLSPCGLIDVDKSNSIGDFTSGQNSEGSCDTSVQFDSKNGAKADLGSQACPKI